MTAQRIRRLEALEERFPKPFLPGAILMPWDIAPQTSGGRPNIRYSFAVSSPAGPVIQPYEQTGRHPQDDQPGSWNRHLYFGEPHDG
jgi:hypothetical protein